MPNTIQIHRSPTAADVPASLAAGELAVTMPDGTLFYGDGTTVRTLAQEVVVQAAAPSNPQTGKFWFDTDTKKLNIYNGSAFEDATGARTYVDTAANAPAASALEAGDLFYETDTGLLKVWDGAAFQTTGVEFASLAEVDAGSVTDKAVAPDTLASVYARNDVNIVSGDTDVITIANPTLADNVTINVNTNVANGLVKLDGSGKIPSSLLTVAAMEFKGAYDASTAGLPSPADTGDTYHVSVAGTQDVIPPGQTTVQAGTQLDIGDLIIYDGTNWVQITQELDFPIAASNISFDTTGTSFTGTDVQAVLVEVENDFLRNTDTIDGGTY